MKAWLGLLVALLMIAPATAQVAAWTDPEGDQTIQYGVTGGDDAMREEVPNQAGWYPHFDITRTGVYDETQDIIVLELMLADDEAQGTEPTDPYVVNYYLYFTYHDEPMRLNMYWYHSWSDEPYTYLERLEGEYWDFLQWVEARQHPDGAGWTFHLPKWDLRDTQLIPAREGDTLGGFHAVAARSPYDYSGFIINGFCPDPSEFFNSFSPNCGFHPKDVAGDASAPLGDYTLTQSPEGLGHILLEVERPFRASNGLATTYVYEMRLFNLDDEPDAVSLSASNTPSGWDVYLPTRIDLDAGEIKDVRMAIGVPFGHKHGESAGLQIHAKSERDPTTTSTTEIVVFWPEIAQPSGHHSALYFHADGYRRWMNTVQEDPASDQSGIVPAYDYESYLRFNSIEDPQPTFEEHGYYWYLYLRPGLFTGLDFETDKAITGNLDIAIDADLDTTVVTELVLFREDMDPIIIGTQEQQVSFTSGESTSVPVSMAVAQAADRIPFEANSALYFIIEIEGAVDDPTQMSPQSLVDIFFRFNDMEYDGELYSSTSFLDLPLLEYHDEVDPGLLDALTRLQLEAPEEITRPVNPGKTAAYFFEVVNKGDVDDTVKWTVEGPKAHWATVVPDYSKVRSDGKATVAIRVDVPLDARSDDVADLLLVGQSTQDPEAQVFGNFIAYVETEADIPDEAERFADLQSTAEETESKGAPFPVVVVFVAVAVAAFARRRTQ